MKFRNYTSSLFLTLLVLTSHQKSSFTACIYLVLYKFRAVVEFARKCDERNQLIGPFWFFFIEPVVLYFRSTQKVFSSWVLNSAYLFCLVRFSSSNVITCMWRAEFWTSRTVVIEEWRFLFFVLHTSTINYHGEEQHNIDSFIIVQYCLLPTLKLAYCRPRPRKLVKEVA